MCVTGCQQHGGQTESDTGNFPYPVRHDVEAARHHGVGVNEINTVLFTCHVGDRHSVSDSDYLECFYGRRYCVVLEFVCYFGLPSVLCHYWSVMWSETVGLRTRPV